MKKIVITITAVLLVGVAFVGISFTRARNTRSAPPCRNNLRIVDGAKEFWAYTNQIPAGATVREEDILPYIKGHKMPKCHLAETNDYMIGKTGEEPRCPIHGNITDYKTPFREKTVDWFR